MGGRVPSEDREQEAGILSFSSDLNCDDLPHLDVKPCVIGAFCANLFGHSIAACAPFVICWAPTGDERTVCAIVDFQVYLAHVCCEKNYIGTTMPSKRYINVPDDYQAPMPSEGMPIRVLH